MTDPGTALTGIATALSLLERVATLAKSLGDTKNKAQYAEMQEKLSETQLKIASITGTLSEQAAENYRLLGELHKAQDDLKAAKQELERVQTFSEGLKFEKNAYWTASGDGPYCVGCWDAKKLPARLTKKGAIYECPNCKTTYIVNATGSFPRIPPATSGRRPGDFNPFGPDDE